MVVSAAVIVFCPVPTIVSRMCAKSTVGMPVALAVGVCTADKTKPTVRESLAWDWAKDQDLIILSWVIKQ